MKGLLLINTGSPSTLSVRSVQEYLCEFLTDPRVIDLPAVIRYPLVYFIIAPRRAPKSLIKYQRSWAENDESLLVANSRKLADTIEKETQIPTFLGMRYNPRSVRDALLRAEQRGVTDLYVLPLFPHYAKSSWETAVVFVQKEAKKYRLTPNLYFPPPYYEHPMFIDALVENILQYLPEETSHLICSYHSLPMSHVKEYRDIPEKNYPAQCRRTTECIINHPLFKSRHIEVITTFQSRFGKGEWLLPDINHTVSEMARDGVQNIAITCPSFVCDCLETEWDLKHVVGELFLEAGGKSFSYIPCLNDHPKMVKAMVELLR